MPAVKPALCLLPLFIPFAAGWVRWQEARILRDGRPLSATELADALEMGVAFPEKIRVLVVTSIPVLNGPVVRFLAKAFPAVSAKTVGLSLRYGIYLRAPFGGSRHLLAHECVHTGQYERAGSIGVFLWDYFAGCIRDGYASSEMELEAIIRSGMLEES